MDEFNHLESPGKVGKEVMKEYNPESNIDVSKEDFPQKDSTSKFTINSSTLFIIVSCIHISICRSVHFL